MAFSLLEPLAGFPLRFEILNRLMFQPNPPSFKHEQNAKTVPQGVSHVKDQGEDHHANTVTDLLRFDLVVVIGRFHSLGLH